MKSPRFVVVTGLSGAGKTVAIRCLEDLGFFCVDNLPAPLLPKFTELCTRSPQEIHRVALGVDVRERAFFPDLLDYLEELRREGYTVEILYLEARDEVLARRFSETRRPHPLAPEGPVLEGIREERRRMQDLRERADRILDTSELTVHELKQVLQELFYTDRRRTLLIHVISFGFKYGAPYDLDLLFDVRLLPNPQFIRELRPLTGRDAPVMAYLEQHPRCRSFLERLEDFLSFLIPQYQEEGKYYLNIGIGCTGGRHRSVYVAEVLGEFLRKQGYEVSVRHRDLHR